jgi:FtsH-binding integral membrane protein
MSYQYPGTLPTPFSEARIGETFTAVMRRVYLWMALGLLLTAGMAAFVSTSSLFNVLVGQPLIFFALFIGELALVVGISWGINRLSPGTALTLFFVYAAINGITLSVLFLVYTLGSVAHTFVATASLFAAMSIIGYTTKMDLSKAGGYLLMALVGLVIAMVVNMFWANSTLEWIVTFAGIFIFLGLTVYDTQRIKGMTVAALNQGDELVLTRVGVIGALRLYLDFINLFLMLLRLMGGRRR